MTSLNFPGQAKLIRIFIALGIVFLLFGTWLFISLRDAVRAEVQRNIVSVGVLKTNQIEEWLDDRISDAKTLSDNSFFSGAVAHWLQSGVHDDAKRREINERMESFIEGHHFRSIVVYDLKGRAMLRAGPPIEDSDHLSVEALSVIASGHIKLIDLHAHLDPQFPVGIGVMSPLREGNRYYGAIYLAEDPELYLFPLIEHWPEESDSAETQLIRVEGDQVLFLNHPRFQPQAKFGFRLPLATPKLAAAEAGRGRRGLLDHAYDYQGNAVLSYAADIPGTSWMLISKINEDEAYRVLDRVYWLTILVAMVFFGLSGMWFRQWWRSEQTANNANLLEAKWQAEKRIQESESRFRTIFERAAMGVARVAPDGRFIEINDTWCDMIGYTSDEILSGKFNFQRITFPGDLATDLEYVRRILAGEIAHYEMEKRYIRKDGSLIWTHLTVSLVRKADGEPDYFISAVQDITLHKQAELKLADTNALLAMAMDAAQEAIWEWDLVSGKAKFPAEYYALLGYAPGEFPATQHEWIEHIHPDDRLEVMSKIKSELDNKQELHIAEYRMRTKSGSYLWMMGRGKCVSFDAEGNPTRMVGINIDITDRKKAELQTNFMAYHDRLTGLPNRSLFFDRLSQAISQAKRNSLHVAILFMDLDGFKPINDEHGHDAGDAVLKMVAQRLLACVRAVDTVARMGGDEFTIILGNLESPSEVERIAEKILQAFSQEMVLPEGQGCLVGVSIGISSYPDNGNEMDKLLSCADAAMYESKRRGKNCFTFCQSFSEAGDGIGNWVPFDEAHHVGVTLIDEQHRELVRRINLLNATINNVHSEDEVASQFDQMLEFTKEHFWAEHILMEKTGYPDMAGHVIEHERLIEELKTFKKKLHEGAERLAMQTIKDWLYNHVRYADKALGNYLKNNGYQ